MSDKMHCFRVKDYSMPGGKYRSLYSPMAYAYSVEGAWDMFQRFYEELGEILSNPERYELVSTGELDEYRKSEVFRIYG